MIKEDESALICDLAETYQIYDYRQLPITQVAVFAVGLRENSRIKMKLSGQRMPIESFLLAGILDRLSFLVWAKTEDGQKGRNRPTMILDSLMSNKKNNDSDVIVFDSGEDYEKRRNEILKNIHLGGE